MHETRPAPVMLSFTILGLNIEPSLTLDRYIGILVPILLSSLNMKYTGINVHL